MLGFERDCISCPSFQKTKTRGHLDPWTKNGETNIFNLQSQSIDCHPGSASALLAWPVRKSVLVSGLWNGVFAQLDRIEMSYSQVKQEPSALLSNDRASQEHWLWMESLEKVTKCRSPRSRPEICPGGLSWGRLPSLTGCTAFGKGRRKALRLEKACVDGVLGSSMVRCRQCIWNGQ